MTTTEPTDTPDVHDQCYSPRQARAILAAGGVFGLVLAAEYVDDDHDAPCYQAAMAHLDMTISSDPVQAPLDIANMVQAWADVVLSVHRPQLVCDDPNHDHSPDDPGPVIAPVWASEPGGPALDADQARAYVADMASNDAEAAHTDLVADATILAGRLFAARARGARDDFLELLTAGFGDSLPRTDMIRILAVIAATAASTFANAVAGRQPNLGPDGGPGE